MARFATCLRHDTDYYPPTLSPPECLGFYVLTLGDEQNTEPSVSIALLQLLHKVTVNWIIRSLWNQNFHFILNFLHSFIYFPFFPNKWTMDPHTISKVFQMRDNSTSVRKKSLNCTKTYPYFNGQCSQIIFPDWTFIRKDLFHFIYVRLWPEPH